MVPVLFQALSDVEKLSFLKLYPSSQTLMSLFMSDVVKEEARAVPPEWPAGAMLKIEESPPEMPAGAVWSNTEQATSESEGPCSKRQRARRDSASRE